jgi:hypothetical protein
MIGNRKKLTTFASEFNTFLLLTEKKRRKDERENESACGPERHLFFHVGNSRT